jgi:hypothetical protein
MYYHDGLPDGGIKSKDRLTEYVREHPDFYELLSQQVLGLLKSNGEMANMVAPIEALADEE